MTVDLLRALTCSALTMSAAILVVLCLRRLLRARFGARVAYILWLLVPLAAAVAWLPARTVVTYLPASAGANSTSVIAVVHSLPDRDSSAGSSAWLTLIWALGAGIAGGAAVLQQRRFVRSLGKLERQTGTDFWRADSDIVGPALVGALRPRIVVPRNFEKRYDARQRELVLAHERMHRVRGDAQINALATMLRCAFWFNPLVYIAASRLRFDQELACDAAVISRHPRARRRYAEAMLNTQLAALGLPAGCHWQSSHPLKERIVMLNQKRPDRLRALCGAALAATFVVGGSYAAWAAQPANVVSRSAAADRIRGDIALRIDGGAEHRLSVLTPPGVEFAVADGDDAERWELRGTAQLRDDGTIVLTGVVRHGETVVSQPQLVMRDGVSAGLHVDDAPSRLDASFVLTRADATAALPPSAYATASEDVSFRAMQPPQYPLAAVKAHQQGHVVLRVHVDEHGAPQAAHVAEADPAEAAQIFSGASVAAAMQWRYNPATIDGKPSAGDVSVPIDYRLVDED